MNRKPLLLGKFKDAARRAFLWTSHDPEGRGARVIRDHEEQLNNDLDGMPEDEQERYIANYKKHFSAWLSAQSRCASSAITGGSGFNVRRAEKANDVEHKRYGELIEWREKALKAIDKRKEAAKPAEQKQDEEWERLRRELDFKLSNPYYGVAQGIYNVVATRAAHGYVEIVEKAIVHVREWNAKLPKPIITERHKFFSLATVAAENREKAAQVASRENGEVLFPGGRIVQNWGENRLQILFNEKPGYEIIAALKKHGFRWAPSVGAWQRQNTGNATYSLKHFIMPLLKGENKE